MVPERLSAYYSVIPLLGDITEWALLRKWSLSEVYRVTLKTGETRIIKWGGKDMAREAAIYEQLVNPLGIPSPRIYNVFYSEDSAVMMMADCGRLNLEQRPSPEHFLEAAWLLAKMRGTAAVHAEKHLERHIINSYAVTEADFLALADDLLRSRLLSSNTVLLRLRTLFPELLHELHESVPLTLVHHDYHAKNLLLWKNNILPIDWSNAYLSPHLGDLYCLMTEARSFRSVPKAELLSAFCDGAHLNLSPDELNWQVNIGGICWLVKTLHWLVYGGTGDIPGSEGWIPDLMNDLDELMCETS